MQVRNIAPSSISRNENSCKKMPQSFQAKVIIDRESFMKCKKNGYKLWTVAACLEPKLQKLPEEFEITLRGFKERFSNIFERIILAPKEGMKVEIKYLLPVEKIKKMILDIEEENPFLYIRQKKALLENEPITMSFLEKPTESYGVISKTRDPKEKITPEETKEFQEMMHKKIVKMIDEMPDRLINFQRYH